jgi:hypothetical protein
MSTPPDLTPQIPNSATPEMCLAMWIDLMNASEEFLLAGLRREIGPDGDLNAAYRHWHQEQMKENDQAMLQMMEQFTNHGVGHDR